MNQPATLKELVDKIEQKKLGLPEMQRGYVWKQKQVSNFLDSLYYNYPSGTILIWKAGEEEDVEFRKFATQEEKGKLMGSEILLDGQQRLTSLHSLIYGKEVVVRDRRNPIDILFNIEHPDNLGATKDSPDDESNEDDNDDSNPENSDDIDDDSSVADASDANEIEWLEEMNKKTFSVSNNRLKATGHWLSVSEIFKKDDIRKTLKEAKITLEHPNWEKYYDRLHKLLQVKNHACIVYTIGNDKSYEEATDIFVRVNSGGTKLRGHDLALAQITAKWRGSLEIFQRTEDECLKLDYDLGMSALLRALIAMATDQCRFTVISKQTPEKLEEAWSRADKAIKHSVDFLRETAEIKNSMLISSPFIAVTIAHYADKVGFKISHEEGQKLRYWALAASLKGRYSRGSSDTLLDQDLKSIADATTGTEVNELLANLKRQAVRLTVEESDLYELNSKSAYFKMMFLVFKENKAQDWFSSNGIALNKVNKRRKLQFHHIFPKRILLEDGYRKQKIDDIRNLVFLDGTTNNNLGATPPEKYLEKIDEEHLISQCVPLDKELWKLDNYEDFLKARGVEIAKQMNKFMREEPKID